MTVLVAAGGGPRVTCGQSKGQTARLDRLADVIAPSGTPILLAIRRDALFAMAANEWTPTALAGLGIPADARRCPRCGEVGDLTHVAIIGTGGPKRRCPVREPFTFVAEWPPGRALRRGGRAGMMSNMATLKCAWSKCCAPLPSDAGPRRLYCRDACRWCAAAATFRAGHRAAYNASKAQAMQRLRLRRRVARVEAQAADHDRHKAAGDPASGLLAFAALMRRTAGWDAARGIDPYGRWEGAKAKDEDESARVEARSGR